MSQKLFYRTACFIFGFAIGVVYFASPSSNQQRAEADSFSASQPNAQSASEYAAPVVDMPEDLESLQREAAHLIELESDLVSQLQAENPAAEIARDSESQQALHDKPLSDQVEYDTEPAAESANPVARQGGASSVASATLQDQKQQLESIVQELSVEELGRKKEPQELAPLPAQMPGARAQLKRLPQGNPSAISRKMYIFDEEGASMEEKVIDIQITTALKAAEEWQPIEFESEDVALSVLQHGFSAVDASKEARDIPHARIVPGAVPAPDAETPPTRPGGEKLASEVTELKQQNVDLKEQVLSLRVMMQALQEDQGVEVSAPTPAVPSPEVLQVRKRSEDVPLLKPITPTIRVNTDSEFESQPGDPVVVRYDRTPLRTGPGTNYSRVAVLPRGTQLTVDYHRQGWFRVYTADGVRAWISEDALQWF